MLIFKHFRSFIFVWCLLLKGHDDIYIHKYMYIFASFHTGLGKVDQIPAGYFEYLSTSLQEFFILHVVKLHQVFPINLFYCWLWHMLRMLYWSILVAEGKEICFWNCSIVSLFSSELSHLLCLSGIYYGFFKYTCAQVALFKIICGYFPVCIILRIGTGLICDDENQKKIPKN